MQKKNMAWISAAVLIVAGGTILLVGRQHHTVAAPLKVTPPTSSATVVSPSSVAPPSTTSVSNVVSSSHVAPKTSAVHTSTPAATTGGQASHSATVTPTTQPKTPPQNTAPHSTAPHSTAPQSTQPQPSKTPAPEQTYPSLAKSVTDKPTASLATIEANINNPQVLGELNWSSADATAVQKILGGQRASSRTMAQYALTFLYASLANNASVFNSPASDQQGNAQYPWLSNVGFAPDNVSQVDAVVPLAVQNDLKTTFSVTYEYRVTYTTTSGQVLTQQFDSVLDPDHLNPAYLNMNDAGWMGNQ